MHYPAPCATSIKITSEKVPNPGLFINAAAFVAGPSVLSSWPPRTRQTGSACRGTVGSPVRDVALGTVTRDYGPGVSLKIKEDVGYAPSGGTARGRIPGDDGVIGAADEAGQETAVCR
jgi:hypothetical protein